MATGTTPVSKKQHLDRMAMVQMFGPQEQQDDITLIAAKCREGLRQDTNAD